MPMISATIRFVYAFVAAGLLALVSCGEVTTVEVGQVQTRDIIASVSASGIIQPEVEVPIASDVSGEITALYIQEGQAVKKNELMFEIRPDNFQAAVDQAAASRNQAKADAAAARAALSQARAQLLQDSIEYARQQQLMTDQATTMQAVQQAQARYQIAQAQVESAVQSIEAALFRVQSADANLNQARDNLSRTRVFSSIEGTVTKMDAELGQRVVGTNMMAGTEVVKVADLQRMIVEVEVNENDVVKLKIGDTAEVEIDAYPAFLFQGQVIEIGYSPKTQLEQAAVDQVTSYPVKVLILPSSYRNNPTVMEGVAAHQSPFRPGMSAVVRIFTDRATNALTAPIQAVTLQRDGFRGEDPPRIVFVFDSTTNKLTAQVVETGLSDERFIEISSGLQAGQVIVTGPYTLINKVLEDGMQVEAEATRSGRDGRGGKGSQRGEGRRSADDE